MQKFLKENFLREWFDFYEEYPTGETAEWYTKMLECIDQIDAGETIIDGKRAEVALIWYVVNFINSLDIELMYGDKWKLERHLGLIFTVIRRMSFLTYRELLTIFPVWFFDGNGGKYFDGTDMSFGNRGRGLLTLDRCGINFCEKDGPTDLDTEIGDNLMKFLANNKNEVIGLFYCTFVSIAQYLYEQL